MSLFGGNLKECRACNEEISSDAETCPHCGEPQEGFKILGGDLKDCRACGEEISTDAEECPNCGEPQGGYKLMGGDLRDCRACGKEISTEAETCPKCGEPQSGYKILGGDIKECRACGEDISTEADECPNCGEPQKGYKLLGGDLMECRTCGEEMSTDADECPNCGEIFAESLDEEKYSSVSTPTRRTTSESSYSSYSGSSYSSGYSDYSSGSTTVQNSNNSSVVGVIVLVVVIIIGFYIYNRTQAPEQNYTANGSQSVSNYTSNSNPPPVVVQPASTNPYGEDNGRASFYHSCILCDNITVYFEDRYIGVIKESPYSDATCSGQGTIFTDVAPGNRLFIFKDEHEQMWKQYINVTKGECILIKVNPPELADENHDAIDDHFQHDDENSYSGDKNSNHWITCLQCHGNQTIEKYGYCKVCTYFGLGGMAISGRVTCPDCRGNGMVNDVSCPRCRQTGVVDCTNCSGKGRAIFVLRCNLCSGNGKIKA